MICKSGFLAIWLICSAFAVAEDGYLTDDGRLILRYPEPTNVSWIVAISNAGHLVPIPPGDLSVTPPDPSMVATQNDNVAVYFVVDPFPSTTPLFGEYVTDIHYNPPSGVFELEVFAGETSRLFPQPPTRICIGGPCNVPEPATLWMWMSGLMCLLICRRRRR